jgi:hypothetical protein
VEFYLRSPYMPLWQTGKENLPLPLQKIIRRTKKKFALSIINLFSIF